MIVKGYVRGVLTDIHLSPIRPALYLEKKAAEAFIRMESAANAVAVYFKIPQGGAFRSYEYQEMLYLSRSKPEVRAVKGAAAKPGTSSHETGNALDINDAAESCSMAEFAQGKRTRAYIWLEKHAHFFGFRRTVKSEHWHWEYAASLDDAYPEDRSYDDPKLGRDQI